MCLPRSTRACATGAPDQTEREAGGTRTEADRRTCPAARLKRPELPRLSPPGTIPERVTRFYAAHVRASPYSQQLRRIVEPSPEEQACGGALDTSGECESTVVTGLQHKYGPTALVLVTDECVSYCRFCFRKRLVGRKGASREVADDYAAIAAYVRRHPEISNVLLSGGDPLALSTDRLHRILDHLLPIEHLRAIRIGTKALVYEPQRLADPELPRLFERILRARKAAVVAIQVDHLGELSPPAEACIRELRAVGVQLLHQAVLLRGVNDDADVLGRTFERLAWLGARPYYLFQARPVQGAMHFQVPLRRGLELVAAANRGLSGLEKTYRYVMSHLTGKIEVLDLGADGRLYLRYHQARDPDKSGKVFSLPYRQGACWLDDLL